MRKPRLVSAGRTGTGRHLIEKTATDLRFVIIGAGRLGASLAIALRGRGAYLAGYVAGSEAGRARADGWLGGEAALTLSELVATGPDLYIVAVPDQVLPGVADRLAEALRSRGTVSTSASPTDRSADHPVVAHTSGATSVRILDACADAGASTLVFHPLQTFSDPCSGATRLAGAAIALTAADPMPGSPALSLGFTVAHLLDARPFVLADDKRGLYHAAASFACNYLVTLEHHAEELFVKAGLPEAEALSLFLPLVRATLDNIAAQGTISALTGPLSRGDTGTVAGHLETLERESPHMLPLYDVLGLATLDVVRARGEVTPATIEELERMLTSSTPTLEMQRHEQRPGA